MSNDEFTKLFRYMQNGFAEMNDRFDAVNAKIDSYAGALDAFAKQSETSTQELLIISHQVTRHDSQIHHIADKTGVKLSA